MFAPDKSVCNGCLRKIVSYPINSIDVNEVVNVKGENMEHINFRKSQEASAGYGALEEARKLNARNVSMDEMDMFEAVEHVQYKKEAAGTRKSESVMNNFEEYRRDMMEKAKAEQKSAAEEEHEANEEAKEIARNLSNEEIKQLRMMGMDVDSASLSDLMDVVNHMRGEAHKEALNQVLARAKMESGDYDHVLITGSGVQTASGDVSLENVAITDVLKNQEDSERNRETQTGQMADESARQESVRIENQDILYLIKNNLPLNRENIYKAHFSGRKNIQQEEPSLPEGMEKQLKKVIIQAGIDVDETSLLGAKQMFAEGIGVTTDTIRRFMQMEGMIGTELAGIAPLEQEWKVNRDEGDKTAKDFCDKVWSIEPSVIADMMRVGQPISIASAYAYMQQMSSDTPNAEAAVSPLSQLSTGTSFLEISAMRQMEEIRLAMTTQIAGRMIKADINIDTRELSQVVAELRAVEQQITKELFARQKVDYTEENVSIYRDMERSLAAIADEPAENLGRLLKPEIAPDFRFTTRQTVRIVTAQTEQINEQRPLSGAHIRRTFAEAERSYEAVGTAPRADMGDSIRKAFGNIEDILRDMELPATNENVRAVRILGYNSIEITQTSIEQIVEYDRQVNDLIHACRPETVLGMIRDGINPLDVPIDELNKTLRQKQYRAGVTETDNFAAYLRDIEKQGAISPEERESYIGIYRMFDKLQKSGDREAGYLFANGSRLTVRNLLSAMRSRKAAGIDVSVDDSLGMLTNLEKNGKQIDTQIARAFTNTNEFERQARKQDGNSYSVREEEVNPGGIDTAWRGVLENPAAEQAEQLLHAYDMEESVVNMQAAMHLLQDMPGQVQTQKGFYDVVSAMLKNLRFKDESEEEAIDRETEAMTKSLMGEHSTIEITSDALLSVLEQDGDLSLTYADMQEQLTEALYQSAVSPEFSSEMLRTAKVVQAGFRILGSMAKQNHYSLPIETKTGTRLMNLTVVRDGSKTGTISIQMKHEKYNCITASLSYTENGRINGEILAGTSEGNMALLTQTERFMSDLKTTPYAEADITLGQRNNVGTRNDDSRTGKMKENLMNQASGRKLMETAVYFVKALGELADI